MMHGITNYISPTWAQQTQAIGSHCFHCNFYLKSLFGADIVYLQQLQQVISNGGGPRLLTEDCVYAYRAASQMGLTFYPRWREQRNNLKPLVLRDCLWFFLDY